MRLGHEPQEVSSQGNGGGWLWGCTEGSKEVVVHGRGAEGLDEVGCIRIVTAVASKQSIKSWWGEGPSGWGKRMLVGVGGG